MKNKEDRVASVKKYVFSLLAILLMACIIMRPLMLFANNSTDARKGVFFYSENVDESILKYVDNNYQMIGESIATNLQVRNGVSLGNLFAVVNCSNLCYLPAFSNNKCIALVSIFADESGNITTTYDSNDVDYFNSLVSGEYSFVCSGNAIYVVGEKGVYTIEKDVYDAKTIVPFFSKTQFHNMKKYSFFDNKQIVKGNTKGTLSKELTNVPYIANGKSICWLCSATAICQYYGCNVSLEDTHLMIHGLSHALSACSGGGTRQDSYNIIHNFTRKNGTNTTTRCTADNVRTSINSNIPVYSSWAHYYQSGNYESGHAMVICGYTFNNSSGAFTYIVMDPNHSDRRYIVSTYSASSVTYRINNKTYTWSGAIYDWH